MADLFQNEGGRPSNKQPVSTPIYIAKTFTGLYTQRAQLHDPSDLVTAKFYGGRPDALWDGQNVELTNKLTLARRPGNSEFSAALYTNAPDRVFSFLYDNVIQLLVDCSDGVYLDNQDGTKTLIYSKQSGAGQAYFMAVGDVCYIGDGVDLIKYTPGNPNGTVWNWGIASPTTQPNVTTVESATQAVPWTGGTVFSTMGLLVDQNGLVQQLVSVNATSTNTTQIGETGSGAPAWNQTPGGTSPLDGTITWTNWGPLVPWTANTTFNNFSVGGTLTNPCNCYDAQTGGVFGNTNAGDAQGTTGASRPNFIAIQGTDTKDGTVKWVCISSPSTPAILPWQPSTFYKAISGSAEVGSTVVEPIAIPTVGTQLPTNQTLFIQASNGGTSGTGGTAPFLAGTEQGQRTIDNQLLWNCLGSATWTNNTTYTQWGPNQISFSAIEDSNGNMQVCLQGGQSLVTGTPSWATTYGSQTTDNNVIWTCVGPPVTWAPNQPWYLPAQGFSPPSSSQPYGGVSIIDTNDNVQFVTSSGTSGGTEPSPWSTTVGGTTSDNTVTWTMTSAYFENSLSWTQGHVYAYSFKARTPDDYYVTNVPPGANPANPLGVYTGSGTGGISTASPVYTIIGGNTGAVNILTGVGSTDPQVDTIVIWRDADGGGASNMFELTEIPAPAPVGGVAQGWTFTDYLPDTPTNVFPGLNNLIPAPIDDANDPPPVGFVPHAYYSQRIFGPLGETVYFSGGPDVITGNPNECFNPSDEFPFLSDVTRLVLTPSGLVTFLTTDTWIIAGGPTTSSFYSACWAPGVGLLSYNALDVYGGEIYFFSTSRQMFVMTPSLQVAPVGFPIGDQLAQWDPSQVYVAILQTAIDNCVFIGDGSTGWYRLNPSQVPQMEAIWSPKATVVGGCKMLQVVQTSVTGAPALLIGGIAADQPILKRDLTVFEDNGEPYDAFFEMGAIVVVRPGQMALLDFLELDLAGPNANTTGYTVEYLLDELTAGGSPPITYQSLSDPIADPPDLYGPSAWPTSFSPNRYYFTQNSNEAAACRFLMLKVDFGTSSNADELFDLTIFGSFFVEK